MAKPGGCGRLRDGRICRAVFCPEGADASFFLCRELVPGYLSGITGEYATPQCYFVAERAPDAFASFDAQFPRKENLKLPGQIF